MTVASMPLFVKEIFAPSVPPTAKQKTSVTDATRPSRKSCPDSSAAPINAAPNPARSTIFQRLAGRRMRLTSEHVIAALRTIRHAVSDGATESLICIPYLTTMLYLPPERRTTFGVRTNTIRLSVGIEPIDQLLADLKQALACLDRGDVHHG